MEFCEKVNFMNKGLNEDKVHKYIYEKGLLELIKDNDYQDPLNNESILELEEKILLMF